MLAQTFNRFFIVVDYQLNKEYIAKTLCENKNKPQMHCNGKCQMMKKLQQEEKKDQQNPDRSNVNKFEFISFSLNKISLSPVLKFSTGLNYPGYQEHYSSRSLSAPFHPPQA
jgi:hypothetical protein